jgi:hypothetical protein
LYRRFSNFVFQRKESFGVPTQGSITSWTDLFSLARHCFVYTKGAYQLAKIPIQPDVHRTYVLQLWRSILLRINATVIPEALKVVNKQAMLLESWLARAGSVPIFCHIKLMGTSTVYWYPQHVLQEYYSAIKEVVSKLVPHKARWQNINLQLPFECLTPPLLDKHRVDAPMLKVLSVSQVHFTTRESYGNRFYRRETNAEFTSAAFPVGDRLREMHLDVPPAFLRIHHPWAGLEELTMVPNAASKIMMLSPNPNVSVSDALHILRRLPNLKRCTLAIGGWEHEVGDELPSAAIVMLKPQKLSLHANPNQFGAFLRAVQLPKLERFIINKHCDPRELLHHFDRVFSHGSQMTLN